MKYCDKCGNQITSSSNFCPNCGKKFNDNNKDNETPTIVWVMIGLLLPIIGAVLYYVLKSSNPKAAKIVNTCSWISIIIYILLILITKI